MPADSVKILYKSVSNPLIFKEIKFGAFSRIYFAKGKT
jgi:hypothetical protein